MNQILLYTEQPVLAIGLKAILPDYAIEVVTTLPALFARLERAGTDLVLIEASPVVTFDVLAQLRPHAVRHQILLWVEVVSLPWAVQAMSAGIRGILRPSLPLEILARAIAEVIGGGMWFDRELTNELLFVKRINLTPREGQLIRLVTQGLLNKEIAARLAITTGTAKVYLSRLYHKMHITGGRAELIAYGLRNMGELPPERAANFYPRWVVIPAA